MGAPSGDGTYYAVAEAGVDLEKEIAVFVAVVEELYRG